MDVVQNVNKNSDLSKWKNFFRLVILLRYAANIRIVGFCAHLCCGLPNSEFRVAEKQQRGKTLPRIKHTIARPTARGSFQDMSH